MSQSAIDTFSVTRHAVDPRADGAARVVRVTSQAVSIERVVQGVRMRIGVPVAAYLDLAISVRVPSGNATLTLRHSDDDLDVVLVSGEATEVATKAKAWGALLGKDIRVEEACVTMQSAFGRLAKRPHPTRRSSFARRRKPGVAERARRTFAGEHEIIARN